MEHYIESLDRLKELMHEAQKGLNLGSNYEAAMVLLQMERNNILKAGLGIDQGDPSVDVHMMKIYRQIRTLAEGDY